MDRRRESAAAFPGRIDDVIKRPQKLTRVYENKARAASMGEEIRHPEVSRPAVAGQAAACYRWPWPAGLAAATTRGGGESTTPAPGHSLQGSSTEAGAVAVR